MNHNDTCFLFSLPIDLKILMCKFGNISQLLIYLKHYENVHMNFIIDVYKNEIEGNLEGRFIAFKELIV